MKEITAMKPVINTGARVLILGSIPGVESLKKQQYYGNPRNHFWMIFSELFNQNLINRDYQSKVKFLLEKKIAVWDVISSCERVGSLDSAIKYEKMNNIAHLLKTYPTINWIGLNGTKAYQSFQKYMKEQGTLSIAYKKLPSTSPVPGRNVKSFPEKVEAWRELKEYLMSDGGKTDERE